jgi:hypothetical protein
VSSWHFEQETSKWWNTLIPMKPHNHWMQDHIDQNFSTISQTEDESFVVSPIHEATYEEVNLEELVSGLNHLTVNQCNDLYQVLLLVQNLFSGKLGTYTDQVFFPDSQTRQHAASLQAICSPISPSTCFSNGIFAR